MMAIEIIAIALAVTAVTLCAVVVIMGPRR